MIAVNAIDPSYIDFALALIGVEGLALLAWRKRTGRGPAPWALIANLAAGASLLLVARALLAGAGAMATLGALTLALAAHIFDLAARWEGPSPPRQDGSRRGFPSLSKLGGRDLGVGGEADES